PLLLSTSLPPPPLSTLFPYTTLFRSTDSFFTRHSLHRSMYEAFLRPFPIPRQIQLEKVKDHPHLFPVLHTGKHTLQLLHFLFDQQERQLNKSSRSGRHQM